MKTVYTDLGVFSDWVEEARRQRTVFPEALPGAETQRQVREALGFYNGPETPLNVQTERVWERDGVAGEEVSWSVGYGPRTHAWVLKPAGADEPLPGVVALHDHGGFKFFGKEKIAQGPDDAPSFVKAYWQTYYGGRAYANALALEGFAVLVHDTFLWGSRRFPKEVMPAWAPVAFRALQDAGLTDSEAPDKMPDDMPDDVAEYNFCAGQHEHVVEKYCNLLGTTMAGVVCHEDRIAMNFLRSRPDVVADHVGCLGLSGGGNRSALLQATYDHIGAAVIVGLMSTYEGLLDHNVTTHTWMFFPSGWSQHGDWPDLAAARAPSPLLVQYDLQDDLFTQEGMKAADERLAELYAAVGAAEAYRGEFYPGPHKFDLEMQSSAFGWLKARLAE